MAVTTKKTFSATTNATTTVFSPVSIQLNNQDDLDVYVTLSGGTRVLQLRQSTGSTAQSSHPQVNNTDGLYFPAVTAGTTLYNYTLSTDNNTITFNSALPQGAVVFCERRTRDADAAYTSFATGSTIRATDLNNSSTESNFTAQDGRNKALTIEGVLFRGDQPSTNFVTSDHIVDGTIVATDIANDSVTADKIPDDTINSEHYVDLSIDTQHIANENITTAKLAADAVTNAKIADNAIDSGKITNGAIDNVHIANSTITSQKIADATLDTATLADNAVTEPKIADNAVTTDKIANGAITDAKIAGGSLDNRYYTETELDAGQLDNRYYTETESDARYFNVSTGDTIKDGDTFPDNDTTIATTAAINDRIIDLVDDVGGFVPIASETAFPAANPDVNNGSGTLVSIKAIGSTRTPSSGTVTIANGAGTGNTVTITGCGSTVLSAGFGVIVETTSTLHTYAFHRLVPKATEVTTVAGNSANVTKVANIDSDVTAVANIDSNVTAVAGNATNINAVAGNATNINAVAADASDIGVVAADGTDIGLVAGSIGNVNTTAGSIASVNTAAANINSIANFGDQYQVASSAPSTDGGGNALAAGDLYFDTTSNELRVHNGSTFQGGVTATGNLAGTGANTFTGNQTIQNTQPTIFLTDTNNNDDYSIQNQNGYFAVKDESDGQNRFVIHPDGTNVIGGNLDVGSGLDVTGNITVSGNVDGRDVAADGTKLDGITANAIADLSEDGSPQLGGNLDVQSRYIFSSATNGSIPFQPNGTGIVEIKGAGGNDGTLGLNCSANTHGIKLKSPPHSAAQTYTLTFPSSLTNNGVLTTNSSGTLNAALLSNANVDASAAIAGTKISPNFGSQNISTTGHLSTKDIFLTDTDPTIFFTDSDGSQNYIVQANSGIWKVTDSTNSADRLVVNSDGHIDIGGNLDVGAGLDVTGNITVSGTVDGIDIATDVAANTAKVTNATHTGDVTGSTSLTLAASGVSAGSYGSSTAIPVITVDAKGRITSASTATTSSDLVDDSSPQLGGQLDTNGNHIKLLNSNKLLLGTNSSYEIYNDSQNLIIDQNTDGQVTYIRAKQNGTIKFDASDTGNQVAAQFKWSNDSTPVSSAELYYGGLKKLETVTGGATISGTCTATTFSGSAASLTNIPAANITGTLPAIDGSNLTGLVSTTAGGAIYENSQTISATHTIPSGSNGMSAGPVTVNNGVTLTISTGSTYTIV